MPTNSETSEPDDAHNTAAGGMPRRGSRMRGVVLGMAVGFVIVILTVLAFFVVNRRAVPQLTREMYESALSRWEEKGPANYDLDLELSGNRAGKIHVEVRGGEVVHMVRDGVEPSQKRTWDYWSVPGMFETIDQELDMARDPAAAFNSPLVTRMIVWAEFDPQLGYPRSYDRVVLGGDFEVHWKVVQFAKNSAKN